jgi:hypothetical protein
MTEFIMGGWIVLRKGWLFVAEKLHNEKEKRGEGKSIVDH